MNTPRALLPILACAAFAAMDASAQSQSLSGTLSAAIAGRFSVQVSFSCAGSPVCTGTYSATAEVAGCVQPIAFADQISITLPSLAQPGPIAGSVNAKRFGFDDEPPSSGGTCASDPQSQDLVNTFTGTWDGASAVIVFPTMLDQAGRPFTMTGTVKTASIAQAFPMTVTSQIDATSASAQAAIQYRAQDVGTTGSVYVFAVAPVTRVTGVTAATLAVGKATRVDGKAEPVVCVLAQLNQAGQLTAASAASLVAYSTGVLSAAGQSVSILNAASTPSVAGATFFVGYGSTSASMVNAGVNNRAVTVPGTVECNPQVPQTGWWWNTAEGGRGYSIEVQGRNLFMAAYFYDASGRATWLVASGPTSLNGSLLVASLYACSGGVTLAGTYRANACSTAGNLTLAFNDAFHGTMIWPGGTVAIERFNIVAGGLATAPLAGQPENGWWWSAAENGRGFFIEWQGGTADVAGYMYDDAGNPIWYITVVSTPNPLAMNGAWWQFANGMTQAGPYRPATRTNDNVGAATIQFQSATSATMTLPGGRQIPLTRFRF